MRDRKYFLREDLETFKRKFKLVCREKKLESGSLIKKYSDLLAQNKNNNYICRIIIKDVDNGSNI